MQYPANRQRTLLQKLIRPSQRKKSGYFIAEGRRVVEQILQNRRVGCEFVLVPEGEFSEWNRSFSDVVTIMAGEQDLLQQISSTVSSQQIYAVCREPEQDRIDELAAGTGLIIVSDALQDPGNAGTIYRTASWFGISGWIHGKGSVDLFQPKVVRSTAGATGALPFCTGDIYELLPRFENQGWQIHLLHLDESAQPVSKWNPAEKQLLIVSNEAGGPSKELSDRYPSIVIPSGNQQGVESLNASVSAGIAMYKWSEKYTG